MTHRTLLPMLSLSLALLAWGCNKPGNATGQAPAAGAGQAAPPSPAGAPAPAAAGGQTPQKEAAEIFATRCTVCHGPAGRGDGAASAGLNPKPRDFQDKAWQAQVTDEHIEKIIQYGGAAVGKSAAMPPNPDLNAKPDVVAALREHVRKLGPR